MGNDPKTAEKANQRQGLEVIGPEATDDQVQQAADNADPNLDGVAALPSTDLGNVLKAYADGKADQLDLFYTFARDLFTHGDLHMTAAEVLETARILGADLVAAARTVAALLPK